MRVRELSRCVCDGRHRRGVLLRGASRERGGAGDQNPDLHHPTTSCVTQPALSPRGATGPAEALALDRQRSDLD